MSMTCPAHVEAVWQAICACAHNAAAIRAAVETLHRAQPLPLQARVLRTASQQPATGAPGASVAMLMQVDLTVLMTQSPAAAAAVLQDLRSMQAAVQARVAAALPPDDRQNVRPWLRLTKVKPSVMCAQGTRCPVRAQTGHAAGKGQAGREAAEHRCSGRGKPLLPPAAWLAPSAPSCARGWCMPCRCLCRCWHRGR